MLRPALLLIIPALAAGCTAARSMNSKTIDAMANLNACSPRSQLDEQLGGVDEKIAIPGGGVIEVRDIMVRNRNANRGGAGSLFTSIITLGIVDLTAGIGDAVYDCSTPTNVSGFNSKCDFKRLRYYFHYADAGAAQTACFEMKEVWVGAAFNPIGDDSKCPKEYKNKLANIIDTSSFPNATLSWFGTGALTAEQQAIKTQLDAASPNELLTVMAADHQANCSR